MSESAQATLDAARATLATGLTIDPNCHAYKLGRMLGAAKQALRRAETPLRLLPACTAKAMREGQVQILRDILAELAQVVSEVDA